MISITYWASCDPPSLFLIRRMSAPALAAKAVEQWQIALDINPAQANAQALRAMIKAYTE